MAGETTTAAPPAKTSAPAADPAAGAAPAVTPEATETIKVNGKEMKVTKAQLIALAQKGAFADGKLKSVEALQKGAAGLLADLKTPEGWVKLLKNPTLGANPQAVISKLLESDIIDEATAEKFEKWVYDKRVRPSKMTPEQIQQEKDNADLAKFKAEKEAREKNEATAKEKAQINGIRQIFVTKVAEAIKADPSLPLNEASIYNVVDKLRKITKVAFKGQANVPVEAALKFLPKAMELATKEVDAHRIARMQAAGDDPQKLIRAAGGDEWALKISRALIAIHKSKGAKKAAPVETEEGARREKTTEAIDRKLNRTPHGYRIMDI